MRTIKFRLRDLSNHIVGYEKWYEGTLNKETYSYTANPCWLYSSDGERWNLTEIPHRYKDSFTGLLDKNSVEIYEGDIIQYHNENGWRMTAEAGIAIAHDSTPRIDMEVIGNIYEHKHLLDGLQQES